MLQSPSCADILANMRERHNRWEAICDVTEQSGVLGTVLTDKNQGRWCLITPDPKPGVFRYSCLDRRGFIGHGEYTSPEAALMEAFDMGFQFLSRPADVDLVILSQEWV